MTFSEAETLLQNVVQCTDVLAFDVRCMSEFVYAFRSYPEPTDITQDTLKAVLPSLAEISLLDAFIAKVLLQSPVLLAGDKEC